MNDSKQKLRSFVQRIERLNEERDAITADRREVFNEADSMGFDKRALRNVIKLRKKDRADRIEEQELTEIYLETVEGNNE